MDAFNTAMAAIGSVIYHPFVLYALLGTGLVFTIWSGFCQYRALTHGTQVIRGAYDDPKDPGAINHFQALSAALSATVGLGNIGGVALAVGLGGPGAVFWMWMVGLLGMALKVVEVTLSMIYRNTQDPDNPHGGPMWVVSKGFAQMKPQLKTLGKWVGALFCVTTLVSTVTGGNMFQAWNVGEITQSYFGIPSVASGTILAILVGLVIIGGVKRIGRVAGSLVPIMVILYILSALYVLAVNFHQIPHLFGLIFESAFSKHGATGAFIGGTMGYALSIGMQRALFSSEAGQGSSPMAHSAVKTDEPVREGVVAGLEPFIDTIVVCTFTALVILSTGAWNRPSEATWNGSTEMTAVEGYPNTWTLEDGPAPARKEGWTTGENVFLIVHSDHNEQTGNDLYRFNGVLAQDADGIQYIDWGYMQSSTQPTVEDAGVYVSYAGATLTARAFDVVIPGLGQSLVLLAVWLFALSTMISWSYYGEQAVVYLVGEKGVLTYKILFCALSIVATMGFIETERELNNFSTLGTGVMLWVNVPIMWIFGYQAIARYKAYIRELKSGRMERNAKIPSLLDIVTGKDVR